MNYKTAPMSDVVAEIVRDGVIDREEVTALRARIMDDGKVDRAEAEALFSISDATNHTKNDRIFRGLYADAIGAHVLEDGVISDDETKWLTSKLGADGRIDGNERALLAYLHDRAPQLPDALQAMMRR